MQPFKPTWIWRLQVFWMSPQRIWKRSLCNILQVFDFHFSTVGPYWNSQTHSEMIICVLCSQLMSPAIVTLSPKQSCLFCAPCKLQNKQEICIPICFCNGKAFFFRIAHFAAWCQHGCSPGPNVVLRNFHSKLWRMLPGKSSGRNASNIEHRYEKQSLFTKLFQMFIKLITYHSISSLSQNLSMSPTNTHRSRTYSIWMASKGFVLENASKTLGVATTAVSKHLMEKIDPDLICRPQEVSLDER